MQIVDPVSFYLTPFRAPSFPVAPARRDVGDGKRQQEKRQAAKLRKNAVHLAPRKGRPTMRSCVVRSKCVLVREPWSFTDGSKNTWRLSSSRERASGTMGGEGGQQQTLMTRIGTSWEGFSSVYSFFFSRRHSFLRRAGGEGRKFLQKNSDL